jgi:hypothetical protein
VTVLSITTSNKRKHPPAGDDSGSKYLDDGDHSILSSIFLQLTNDAGETPREKGRCERLVESAVSKIKLVAPITTFSGCSMSTINREEDPFSFAYTHTLLIVREDREFFPL